MAPNIGDGGFLGAPTLESAMSTAVGLFSDEPIPSFGLLYAGVSGIGLLPHDIERAHEFMLEHAGHLLFISGDHMDGDAIPEEVLAFEEGGGDHNWREEMDALDSERERRVASGEFVEAFFTVSCGGCKAELKAPQPELLKAHTGKVISESDAKAFVAAWDRAADDGWNHRLMGIVDPYEPFMSDLIVFIGQHAGHGLTGRMLPAPPGSSRFRDRRTL
jgi:hypothetical protein